jgi:hypothetical protein
MAFAINVYDSSLHIPDYVIAAMQHNEPAANCTLPILLKSRLFESHNQIPPQKQVWVVCTSKESAGEVLVELVLSVTEGYIDSYPPFFFSSIPSQRLTQDFIQPRMEAMVRALSGAVPRTRVYAVYGPDILARAFAWSWTYITGVQNYVNSPYYAAKLSFCTRQTFKSRPPPLRDGLIAEIRPATVGDIPELGQSCFGFAADSVCFRRVYIPFMKFTRLMTGAVHPYIGRSHERDQLPGSTQPSMDSPPRSPRIRSERDRFHRRFFAEQ